MDTEFGLFVANAVTALQFRSVSSIGYAVSVTGVLALLGCLTLVWTWCLQLNNQPRLLQTGSVDTCVFALQGCRAVYRLLS